MKTRPRDVLTHYKIHWRVYIFFYSTQHNNVRWNSEQLRKNAFEGEGMTAGREENKE